VTETRGSDRTNAARYFANKKIGDQGEALFRLILRRFGMDRYFIRKSLGIPSMADQRDYSGDVDFAITNGNILLLIDVKKWARGFHYWSVAGFPFKNLTPILKDGDWRLSANMALALDRYSAALPDVHVSAMVVFVPTSYTDPRAVPASVSRLVWPGGIRSYISGRAMGEIEARLGRDPVAVHPNTAFLLNRMTRSNGAKKESQ